jgi:hypothetical protein
MLKDPSSGFFSLHVCDRILSLVQVPTQQGVGRYRVTDCPLFPPGHLQQALSSLEIKDDLPADPLHPSVALPVAAKAFVPGRGGSGFSGLGESDALTTLRSCGSGDEESDDEKLLIKPALTVRTPQRLWPAILPPTPRTEAVGFISCGVLKATTLRLLLSEAFVGG